MIELFVPSNGYQNCLDKSLVVYENIQKNKKFEISKRFGKIT